MTIPESSPPWIADLRPLKRWLAAHLVLLLVLWVGLLRGVGEGVAWLLVMLALVPYVGCIVYAYRIQRSLNRAGLYKPGAWLVIVGALLFNPIVVGWLIPVSVLRVAHRLARARAAQRAPEGTGTTA